MQLLPRPSSKAISVVADSGRPDAAGDPGIPVAVHSDHRHADSARRPRHRLDGGQHVRGCRCGDGADPGRPGRHRAGQGGLRSRRPWSCSRSKPRSCARSMCATAKRCMPARCWRGSIRPSPPPTSARWPRRSPACRRRSPASGGGGRPAVHLYRARSQPVAAGGDLRASAQAEYSLQAGELYPEGERPDVGHRARQIPMRPASAAGFRSRPASSRCGANSSGCRSAASSTRLPRWTTARRWSATCAVPRKRRDRGAARPRRHGRRA